MEKDEGQLGQSQMRFSKG